jgi:hypothetical protein
MARKKKPPVKKSPDIIQNENGSVTYFFDAGIDHTVNIGSYVGKWNTYYKNDNAIHMIDEEISISGGDGEITKLVLEKTKAMGGFVSGNTGQLWMYHSPGEIFTPLDLENVRIVPWNIPEVKEPSESYWTGGTNEDKWGKGVDVFIEKTEISVGVHDGDKGIVLSLSRDDALKLIKILQEGTIKADEWDRYLKQEAKKNPDVNEDSVNAETNSQDDDNIY